MMRPPGRRLFLWNRSAWRIARDPIGFLTDLSREFGDVAGCRISLWDICLVNNPEYIKELLIERHRDLAKLGGQVAPTRAALGRGLLTSDGELHLRHRRLLQPAFQRSKLAGYARIMSDLAGRLNERCRDGASVDIYNEMSVLTLSIMAAALFGADVDSISGQVREALVEVFRSWNFVAMALPSWLVSLTRSRRLRRALAGVNEVIYRIISERRAGGTNGAGREDLLSLILRARDVGDGTGMTDEQVRDQVMTFFLAGHETIATTLSWTWYRLSQHPDIEERLHAELERVLGGRPPTFEDLPRLSYTRMILREVLRMYPPIWGLWRQATREVPLGPYRLRAGTIFVVSPYVTQHDPRWYDDPERFDPERWADEEEVDRREFSYFPFGGGPRLCIGEQFGTIEGMLVLASLAQHWKLRLVPGQQITPYPGPVLQPRHGIRMTFAARALQASQPGVGS